MAYNGHRSKAAWNVALWIGNDETLYRFALHVIANCKTRESAARTMLANLPTHTPDGFRYTRTSVSEALAGLSS